jgi:alanyl-tRNA synthetase
MPEKKPLPVFEERGYKRAKCPKCGSVYWSKDGVAKACGDTPCVEYSFIGKPPIKGSYDLDRMREAYLRFFDKDHTRVGRNPVVARWRDDVFLVNASIYDFQPHVTSGEVPPPANPLVISQPCIRMTDLDSVGRSGRHLSNFEMMAHHAFNYPDKEVYWDDQCVRYCVGLLEKLGVDEHLVIYKENPWVGGGNAGHALEVMVDGLELATLVFMNLREDPNGTIIVKGGKFSPMDIKIVDTGYGLERFLWASRGTPTIYDAIYPEVLKKVFDMASVEPVTNRYPELGMEWAKASGILNLDSTSNLVQLRGELVKRLRSKGQDITIEKLTEIMEPVERVYAIVDHARCLALMLNDELIPSNVKAGYLVRLVLRKALRHIEELGIKVDLADLVMMHKDNMKGITDLSSREEFIRKVLALETERYKETASKAKKLVEKNLTALKEGSKKGYKALITLYDTHGLHPSLVKKAASELGSEIEVPDGFEAMVAEQHSSQTPEEVKEAAVPKWILDIRSKVEAQGLPETRTVYYDQVHGTEFDAVVLFADKEVVVLDQTMFYPEGGGQPSDRGTIVQEHTSLSVTDVQKLGKVILHKVEGRLPKVGTIVKGRIDRVRRLAHMRHHTGTHVVLASARQVLGPHVWQAGAQKGAEEARIDITHFARITDEERRRIEFLANEVVLKAIPIEKVVLQRDEAERRFGFRLYQGGAPTSKTIRVVRIGDFDVQGCGGTHLDNTGEIGLIKINKTERIQDGVVRIEFSAGIAAVKNIQRLETLLEDSSSILSVPADQLPKTVERFFEEWKRLNKEIKELKMGALDPESLLAKAEKLGNVKFVVAQVDMGMNEMIGAAKETTEKEPSVVVLVSVTEGQGAQAVVARSATVELDAREVIKEVAKVLGGKGGGKPFLAQGGGPNGNKTGEALEKAKAVVRKALDGK